MSQALALQPLADGAVLHAGLLRVPGSKSITNRALICAALADGGTTLMGAQFSDDSKWMAQCLRDLGYAVGEDKAARSITVHGLGGRIPEDSPAAQGRAQLFVGNAGTAARFLPCLVGLAKQGAFKFAGDARMSERPIKALLDVLKAQGAKVRPRLDGASPAENDRYPFELLPAGLSGGEVHIDLTASTQFASGLMMAAPYMASDLNLVAEGDRQQLPYVDMTLAVMEQFGVLGKADNGRYTVAAGQRYKAQGAYAVEPDLSGAAYLFAAVALAGGKAGVLGVGNGSIQGDIRFLKVLQHLGVRFYAEDRGPAADGSPQVGLLAERFPTEPLKGGVTVDMNAFSDQALTLAALAPFAGAPISITNIAHSRRQECDRIHAMVVNLRAVGIQVEEREDGVTVHPGRPHGATISTFGDHRVAMAFSLLGLRVPGIVIDDPACVAKTFADYWDVYGALKRGEPHEG
jgi:3-phosphoshikimate 1-carboxyvinyltransferase